MSSNSKSSLALSTTAPCEGVPATVTPRPRRNSSNPSSRNRRRARSTVLAFTSNTAARSRAGGRGPARNRDHTRGGSHPRGAIAPTSTLRPHRRRRGARCLRGCRPRRGGRGPSRWTRRQWQIEDITGSGLGGRGRPRRADPGVVLRVCVHCGRSATVGSAPKLRGAIRADRSCARCHSGPALRRDRLLLVDATRCGRGLRALPQHAPRSARFDGAPERSRPWFGPGRTLCVGTRRDEALGFRSHDRRRARNAGGPVPRGSPGQNWVVEVHLTPAASKTWDTLAMTSFHQLLAIDQGGTVISAPLIEPTQASFSSLDGKIVVSGGLTHHEAASLATAINGRG